MSDPNPSKSDSDVSSSSSWDVIDESEDSRSSSLEVLIEEDDNRNCVAETSEVVNDIENTFISITDEGTTSKIDNEESPLVEQPIDPHYTATDTKEALGIKTHYKSKSKSKKRKIKAEPLNVFAVAGSIITVTVLTVLCLLFPTANVEKISRSTNTNDIQVRSENPKLFEADINNTAELLNTINFINMHMNHHENGTEEDGLTDEEMCYIEEEIGNVPGDSELFDIDSVKDMKYSTSEAAAKALSQQILSEIDFSMLGLQNVSISLMKELRGVLMAPNFQLFLCTLMQDICLIRLVKQLEKKTELFAKSKDTPKKPDLKKIKTLEKISKKLNDRKKNRNNKKLKKLKKAIDLTMPVTNNYNQTSQILSNPIFKSKIETDSDFDVSSNKFPIVTHSNTENGKSECERRFEELDCKWESVGHNHRLKVQEIKEKFRNELHHIRENEKDFPLRKQRMKMIREKYLQKLKLDREKYLNQLRKLRDERHVVLKGICGKKEPVSDSKDVSIGNHALLLPGIYDFQQKLQEVRERESGKTSHVTASSPVLHPVKAIDYPKNYSNSDFSKKVHDNVLPHSHQNYMDKMKKYYEMKNNILKKKSERAALSTIAANFTEKSALLTSTETLSNSTKLTESPLIAKRQYGEDASTKSTFDADNSLKIKSDSNSKMILKKKQKKRELYDLAFDENGEKIMKSDYVVPDRSQRGSSPTFNQSLRKQDPKTPTKRIFTFKGKL